MCAKNRLHCAWLEEYYEDFMNKDKENDTLLPTQPEGMTSCLGIEANVEWYGICLIDDENKSKDVPSKPGVQISFQGTKTIQSFPNKLLGTIWETSLWPHQMTEISQTQIIFVPCLSAKIKFAVSACTHGNHLFDS
eukprot:3531791-Amphidinium_carterae.1